MKISSLEMSVQQLRQIATLKHKSRWETGLLNTSRGLHLHRFLKRLLIGPVNVLDGLVGVVAERLVHVDLLGDVVHGVDDGRPEVLLPE